MVFKRFASEVGQLLPQPQWKGRKMKIILGTCRRPSEKERNNREETGSVARCWCCSSSAAAAAGAPSPIFFSVLHPPGGFYSTCFFFGVFVLFLPLCWKISTFPPSYNSAWYLPHIVSVSAHSARLSLHATSTAERGRISINRQRPAQCRVKSVVDSRQVNSSYLKATTGRPKYPVEQSVCYRTVFLFESYC